MDADSLEFPPFEGLKKRDNSWMKVTLDQKKPVWPNRCACCGEKPTTTIYLEYTEHEEHIWHNFDAHAPSCERCKQHYAVVVPQPGRWVNNLVFCLGIICIALAGARANDDPAVHDMHVIYDTIYGIVAWIVVVVIGVNLMERGSRKVAEKEMASYCSGAEFVSFRKSFLSDTAFFYYFTSPQYADLFAKANQAVVQKG